MFEIFYQGQAQCQKMQHKKDQKKKKKKKKKYQTKTKQINNKNKNPKKKKKKDILGSPIVAQRVKNLNSIHEDVGSIPGLDQWVKNPTAAAWVTTKESVQSLAWCSG